MTAWAATAAALVLGMLLLRLVAPGAAQGWSAVTRAFIAAPLALVALTLVTSAL